MTRFSGLLDRIAAAAGLVLLAPLLAVVAAAILLESGLPILFRQSRIGQFGLPFTLLKFRSMRLTEAGIRITSGNDGRITRLGRVLRKYKIDEVPQLWNVLKGEMALVGPRPEVPAFVDLASATWVRVLSIRPGITDLASLLFRHEEQILSGVDNVEEHYRREILPQKLILNEEYLRIRSLATDLLLIALTIEYSLLPSRWDPGRIRKRFGGLCGANVPADSSGWSGPTNE